MLFRSGFAATHSCGSINNDGFTTDGETISKTSNHSGGVLGGMSDGDDVVFRVAIKPTPSISMPQATVNEEGEAVDITIHGRHDPVIVPRAVVVVECMAAMTILDLLFANQSARLESLQDFYNKQDQE